MAMNKYDAELGIETILNEQGFEFGKYCAGLQRGEEMRCFFDVWKGVVDMRHQRS